MKSLEEFVKYVRKRAYNLDVRYAGGQNKVLISVDFISADTKERIISRKERKWFYKLIDRIKLEMPDRVEIIIYVNDVEELHRYEFGKKEEKVIEEYKQPQVYQTQPVNGFSGFSSENIEAVVNKRLEEERRERMLQELQSKLGEGKEELVSKQAEIEVLQNKITEKDEKIEQLEKSIENKKNFKYYAGITGDILQSFGIKKEIIGKPLAGLLVGDNEDDIPALEQGSNTTEAVQQASAFTKRDEMINLLYQYIESIEDSTLEKVFEVFSEIENKPSSADQILEFIKANK